MDKNEEMKNAVPYKPAFKSLHNHLEGYQHLFICYIFVLRYSRQGVA